MQHLITNRKNCYTPHGFLVFSGVQRVFVRQQDDIDYE